MKKVFLDTNILYRADKFSLNIEDIIANLIGRSTEILIHPVVEAEIIGSLMEPGKIGLQANLAMKLLSLFTQYLDEREYNGPDTALFISAKRENATIFTLDQVLKKRCIRSGIPVISTFKKGRFKLYGDDYLS